MGKRIRASWILGVLIGLFLVNGWMEIKEFIFQPRTDYEGFKARLDQTLPVLMKKYRIPGAALAVIRKGKADLVKGYGWADVKVKRAVDGDTLFQVASNSKTVTVWGVMKLVETGKLELDAPVEKYLTRWKLPPSKYNNHGVTIRRILSHTAGLSQSSYAGYPPESQLPTLEQSLSGQAKGGRELHLLREPGEKYQYSGGGYTLIQLLTEEVTGQSFTEYMTLNVLKPLEMENSTFEWSGKLRDKTAKGYGVRGEELPNYLFTETAAAGLFTNASDLARFVAANLKVIAVKDGMEGAAASMPISLKSLALMYTPIKKDYGLGYIIKDLPDHTRLIYHGGANRGWRSQFALLPERGDGLAILTNSEYGESLHQDLVSLWTRWETGFWPGFYLKNVLLRTLVKTVALMLIVMILLTLWSAMKEFREDKRWLIFTKKPSPGARLRLAAGLILPVLVMALWGISFYTGLIYKGWAFASFMPAGFTWVTVAVVFGCLFFFLRGFFPKER
jgi:CubicO group peptidase (beta-lactamase class C family)